MPAGKHCQLPESSLCAVLTEFFPEDDIALLCQATFIFPTPSTPVHTDKPHFPLFHIAISKPFLVLCPPQISTSLKVMFCNSVICYPFLCVQLHIYFLKRQCSVSLSSGISAIIFGGINTHLNFFWPFVFLTFPAPVIFFFFNPMLAKFMVIPLILLHQLFSHLQKSE